MKINFLDSSPVVYLVKFSSLVLRKLPFGLSLWIGRLLGRLFFYLNFKARKIAYANLRLAFSCEFTPFRIKKILREVFQHVGMNIVEVLKFPSFDKKYVEKYVKFAGFEKIKESLEQNKGLIYLTAHFGNWELSAQASSLMGFPMMVLATEQKHNRLNELLNYYRSIHGCHVISKGLRLREILRGLRKNEIVGMLCDQDGGRDGLEVDFFGRSATVAPGPFEIALKNNSRILPCFNVRGRNGHHTIYIENPLVMEKGLDDKRSILEKLTLEFNGLLEEKIKQFPAQWLWSLKRWKSSRERAVVILCDGKAGHLNQARAVAAAVTEELSELSFRVVGDYQVKKPGCKIIEVRFINKFRRAVYKMIMPLVSRGGAGCWRILRFVLEKESFLELQRCYADIFISSGSALAGINLLLTRENLAKSVVVMKPSLPLAWFDLAVLPAHDLGGVKRSRNIVATLGAPVYFDAGVVKSKSAELMKSLKLENTPRCISIFFGGETPFFTYDRVQVEKIVEAAKEAAGELKTKILVTTSRRSPSWLEDFLEKEFGREEKCAFLLIANKANMPDAVAGFLGLSRVAIISGESVSMISEAVSTDRQLIVFLPKKKKAKLTKQEKFIRQLEEGGYVNVMNSDLKTQITDLFSGKPREAFTADKNRVKEAVKFLV